MSSSSGTAPTIGIITALPKEYAAVQAMMDNGRDAYPRRAGAHPHYFLGEVPAAGGGIHTVVLALAVAMGNNVATIWASNLTRDYPTVHTVVMVGIAGGIPHPEKPEAHVRLGDIVISSDAGVVQYDFVTEEADKIVPRFSTHRPSVRFLQAVRELEAEALTGRRPWVAEIGRAKSLQGAARPEDTSDVLYRFEWAPNGDLTKKRVRHPTDRSRVAGQPRVFVGPIASSNTLQKNPFRRDQLREQYGVKAVEMEGSGIADATWVAEVGYLVVRGICDYCDPAKNDTWQSYAAVAAAAYVRALLQRFPPADPGASDASMPAVLPLSVETTKGAPETVKVDPKDQLGDGPVTVHESAVVQVLLSGKIGDFTAERRKILVGVMATVLKINASQVHILRTVEGSIRVFLTVPRDATERLRSLSWTDKLEFAQIGVRVIKSGGVSVNIAPLGDCASLLTMVILNLALLATLTGWLYSLIHLPCYRPLAPALSGAFTLWTLLHVIWRPVSPALARITFRWGSAEIEVKKMTALVDLLHPSGLSDLWLWIVAGIVVAVSVAAFLTVGRIRTEDAPVVDQFSVKYIGVNPENNFSPRVVVPVQAEQHVLIRAVTLCKEPRCTWTTAEGTLSTASGCATYYVAPRQETWDFVDVKVETRCKTQSTWRGLFIQVVQSTP